MDNSLALMTGVNIPFPEIQASIHQPTIREISYMGEKEFFIAVQYLCLDKKTYIKDESVLETITNFQVFMTVLQDSHNLEGKDCVISLLSLLFPTYKVILMPKSLILNNLSEKKTITIDETIFETFQSILSDIFCAKNFLSGSNITYNPKGKKAQEIADKIMKGRKRLTEEKGEDKESIFTRYISILTIGLNSMSINDCLELTIYQMYDLVERYQLYVNWNIDLRVRLAGGKPDNKPENWMKNIH